MQAKPIIDQVAELLQDTNNVTWTRAQLLGWLNDAQLAIALVRPDAAGVTAAVKLAAGTRQSIPAGGLRLLSVVRNMGANGQSPGAPVRLVERGIKDDLEPGWHTDTPAVVVNEYVFDDRAPRDFYVSPPVDAVTPVWVDIAYAQAPAALTQETDAFRLDDVYGPVAVEWMMFRAFERDAEDTPGFAKSATHYQAFFNLLGVKLKSDASVSPKVRGYLK